MAEPKKGGDVNAFIREYSPIADRVGKELNVDPKILLAQWGNEVGWGASIQGSHNLGNIKSATGKGKVAKDNQTGSVDPYLNFEDPEVFADYYAGYIKRRFPEVIGSGSDVKAFTAGLRPGTQGGYAEDKEYGSKLTNAFSLVNARMESQQPQGNQYESTFGVGTPTEAQRMKEEGFGETTTEGSPASETPDLDAALYGGAAGLVAGQVAKGTKIPSSARYESAMERLRVAEDKLTQARASGVSGNTLADLENELKMRQSVAMQAADELKAAEAELRAASKVTPAATSAAGTTSAPDPRKLPGSSGSANWARKMSDEIPDIVAESATSMRKADEKGAQRLIDKDVAARQKLSQMGLGDYELSGRGPQQLSLPTSVAEERAAAMEAELARKQAEEAAERAKLAQQAEANRIAAQNRVELAKQARRGAGTAVGEQSQVVRDARQAQKAIDKAQAGVNVAEARVARTPSGPEGVLGKTGAATAKVAPRVLGVISGAATGLSAMDAIDKFKKGDYSGAVLPTLEATFGVMSMLPPSHPVLLALRGLGTLGGAALLGYEGYKYATDKPKAENVEAP